MGETSIRRRQGDEHRRDEKARLDDRLAGSLREGPAQTVQDVRLVRSSARFVYLSGWSALDANRQNRRSRRSVDVLLQPVPSRLGFQRARRSIQRSGPWTIPPLLG